METYVLITYKNEEISKDDCFVFESEKEGLDLDPYGDDVPFVVGGNQAIYTIDDSPYIPEN